MISFKTDPHIAMAGLEHIPALKALLNSAYRGESSKKGWTTEAHLIAGEVRTDEHDLLKIFKQKASVFLLYIDAQQQLVGCVNLQQHGNKIYLGMLSVSPLLQGFGIGKVLLQAAEDYAAYKKCNAIYMTVVSVRTELIDWYIRHGYRDTGEKKPFPEDGLTGKHLQELVFSVLEKELPS
jgi:ribosomal protein S18 acetylase RimI-like enzyme